MRLEGWTARDVLALCLLGVPASFALLVSALWLALFAGRRPDGTTLRVFLPANSDAEEAVLSLLQLPEVARRHVAHRALYFAVDEAARWRNATLTAPPLQSESNVTLVIKRKAEA